jgi:peptidoglycan/LPS O-acetylase OafA/YrhL
MYNFLFRNGWLGVQLFFLISGFVILMTLEKCPSFHVFVARRWRRLFPAMLIASFILYAGSRLLPAWPMGPMTPANFIPGLTFLDSDWIGIQPLDGAFWSLFAEVKFYLFFGSLYFLIGTRGALICLTALALPRLAENLFLAVHIQPEFLRPVVRDANTWFAASNAGWFAAGAVFYLFRKTGDWRVFAIAIGIAIVDVYILPPDGRKLAVAVVALFAAPLVLPLAGKVLASPIFVFVGFISYPLYLLHENLMVGGSQLFPQLGWASVLPPLSVIIAGSWLIARYFEPFLRSARFPFRLTGGQPDSASVPSRIRST